MVRLKPDPTYDGPYAYVASAFRRTRRTRYCTHMKSPRSVASAAVLLLAACAPASAQSTEPFDHVHLAVPDVERARDWYIQHMGGNVGETPETVSWGKWPGDHPLPVNPLFPQPPAPNPGPGRPPVHAVFAFQTAPPPGNPGG